MTGEYRQANSDLLVSADVSARSTDDELQVLIADDRSAVLAALVFHLCERAERLSPYIAKIIDDQGYPFTDRDHVLEPIIRGNGMHLRPYKRRFLIFDDVYLHRTGTDHLFGRPFSAADPRRGISMQLANESSDALTGYGGVVATDQEKQEIRSYTRRLFAEVIDGADLVAETEKFMDDIKAVDS